MMYGIRKPRRPCSHFCQGFFILGLMLMSLWPISLMAEEPRPPLSPSALFDALRVEDRRSLPVHETRQLPEMKRSIKTSGQLEFRPPDALAKQVLLPKPANYRIEGQRLTMTTPDAKESLEMDLATIPALHVLSETLQAVFSGDIPRIERLWVMHLGGSWNRWRLVLTPQQGEEPLAIREIQIEGHQSVLDRMTLMEATGAVDSLEFR